MEGLEASTTTRRLVGARSERDCLSLSAMPDALVVIDAAVVDEWPDDPDYRPGTAYNAMHLKRVSAIFSTGDAPVCVNCTDQIREVAVDQVPEGAASRSSVVVPLSRQDPKTCWIHVTSGSVHCDAMEDPAEWEVEDRDEVMEHVAWPDPGLPAWLQSATLVVSESADELKLIVVSKGDADPIEVMFRRDENGRVAVSS